MVSVASFLFLLLFFVGTSLGSAASPDLYSDEPHYKAEDDVSWAITKPRLSTLVGKHIQERYDDFISKCEQAAASTEGADPELCEKGEVSRMIMNRHQPNGVYNYTKTGFAKIKCPKTLFNVLYKFYKQNIGRDKVEWPDLNTYHNLWDTNPTIMHLNEKENHGGGPALQSIIFTETKRVLEDWTGQELSPVSLYGVRLYHNGSILAPHVDRLPLVISAIINIEQQVDEPWPLEVYGHDGVARNLTMAIGDMILYESHSVIHGRPFPLRGNLYANVFIHFEPIGPNDDNLVMYDPELDIPPYVVPYGGWHHQWKVKHEKGWFAETFNAMLAASKCDITMLKMIAKHNPIALGAKDDLGWEPIHEATRSGNIQCLKLILGRGIDINTKTYTGVSPLNIAREFLGEMSDVTIYLKENGAFDINEDGEL